MRRSEAPLATSLAIFIENTHLDRPACNRLDVSIVYPGLPKELA
jgi:hypothetical protein